MDYNLEKRCEFSEDMFEGGKWGYQCAIKRDKCLEHYNNYLECSYRKEKIKNHNKLYTENSKDLAKDI